MAGTMPLTSPSPFGTIQENSRLMTQAGLQNEQNAQNMLMAVFQQEAARQRPWSDLPVDLALQNNAARNSLGNAVSLSNLEYNQKSQMIPEDAFAIGSTLIDKATADLGIPVGAAAGLVGNLASESGNFKYTQEISPVVPGSRGGAGWAMWTGPRRKEFEQYTNGDVSSPEANYAYLIYDLKKNYPDLLAKLQQTNDPLVASKLIHDQYLNPGVKHDRKSALNTIQFLRAYTENKNKQYAGDAEYDRRQARTGNAATQKREFTYGGNKFTLPSPEDDSLFTGNT